ncbi:MAG: nucleoside phosphorylase [Cyclobacteriaceae bacterium]|nr:nucleoside phosphorylase [Cyclobacteriaceae bacterium]
MSEQPAAILLDKHYEEPSLFLPENLLREARRQKNLPHCRVPSICLFDPDGDLFDYLKAGNQLGKIGSWACYHSELYRFKHDGIEIGIIPRVVGASYAVLIAEQLFVSGCEMLISLTSAGIINPFDEGKRFALITEAIRDEGTSYHYIEPEKKSRLAQPLLEKLLGSVDQTECPYFQVKSWTTDAPYRETQSAIEKMKKKNVGCVEMEASALYAFAIARQKQVICFAHLTNNMAQHEGDFEKGEHFGSVDSLHLLSYVLKRLFWR